MHLPRVLTMVCNTRHKNGIKHVQTKVNIFLYSCGAKINKKLPITPAYGAQKSELVGLRCFLTRGKGSSVQSFPSAINKSFAAEILLFTVQRLILPSLTVN